MRSAAFLRPLHHALPASESANYGLKTSAKINLYSFNFVYWVLRLGNKESDSDEQKLSLTFLI